MAKSVKRKKVARKPLWATIKTTDYYHAYEAPILREPDEEVDCPGEELILSTGDEVSVRWPDGCITRETISIIDGRRTVRIDPERVPDTFDTRCYVVKRAYHGVVYEIPLKGCRVTEEIV